MHIFTLRLIILFVVIRTNQTYSCYTCNLCFLCRSSLGVFLPCTNLYYLTLCVCGVCGGYVCLCVCYYAIATCLYIENQVSLGILCWFQHMHYVDFVENALFNSSGYIKFADHLCLLRFLTSSQWIKETVIASFKNTSIILYVGLYRIYFL